MGSSVDLATELASLRLQGLNEDEGQWLAGSLNPGLPLGPQNEASALTKLVEQFPGAKAPPELTELCNTFVSRTSLHALRKSSGYVSSSQDAPPPAHGTDALGQPYPDGSLEDKMAKWASQHGIITCLQPAAFPIAASCSPPACLDSNPSPGTSEPPVNQAPVPGGNSAPVQMISGRGLMAATAVPAGRTLVSVPLDQLISYSTAIESDLGAVLQRIPGLNTESAVVIWTMLDRCDRESPRAPFWAALPKAFGTGLGVSSQVLHTSLHKCPDLLDEALQARQHVRQQFDALGVVFNALVKAYPQYIKSDQLDWHAYLWAVQLWYAYAIQVQMADGQLQPCLVPLTILMNHSPWPHAVAFSRLDVKTNRLNVKSFRALSAGQEALLSYGPLPNAKLLLFYGFAVRDNPYDQVSLCVPDTVDTSGDVGTAAQDDRVSKTSQEHRKSLMQACGLSYNHRVRGWGPLPPALLAVTRLATASAAEVAELHASYQPAHSKAVASSKSSRKKQYQQQSSNESAAQAVLHRLCTSKLSVASERQALQLLMSMVDEHLARLTAVAALGHDTASVHSDEDGEFDDGAAGPGFKAAASVYIAGQVQVLGYVHQVLHGMLLQVG